MKKKLPLVACATILIFLFTKQNALAQTGVAINNDGSLPNSSAMLDVKSTNKGVLVPRMTFAEKITIPSPANSLLVYQKDEDYGYYSYDSIAGLWRKLSSNSPTSCQTIIPIPAFPEAGVINTNQNSNTIAFTGEVLIQSAINANQITIETGIPANVPGSVKIALYSENGQSKLFEISTGTISSAGLITTALNSPTPVSPGYYYITILPIGSTDVNIRSYNNGVSNLIDVAGKNVLSGTITVSANTLPSTFNPTTIVYSPHKCIIFRLDN